LPAELDKTHGVSRKRHHLIFPGFTLLGAFHLHHLPTRGTLEEVADPLLDCHQRLANGIRARIEPGQSKRTGPRRVQDGLGRLSEE
jgi:hypothetical protein